MQTLTRCMRCNVEFWSKGFKNKLKEKIALRSFCRTCENEIRYNETMGKNDKLAKKQGKKYVDKHPLSTDMITEILAQVEKEREIKEKREKKLEKQRHRTETQI